ncbi:AraJ Arabinose efflux permease [Pyrenophora tritici-repentis]|uniref:AraJ, Arabinose efflux permease n=2 Tax=Pyrenophora tritici-repentis TaxID=45151 RepID=A0A2W1E3R3_9PLEO|nr:High affinity glucose transporter ght1 [Pyrenophora tritici-repentis]KAF7451960.1 High affinity glucose transporter ght1 [Pyrenophora tritici-repentis]KAF7574916.1 AraJ, Arabinose efflux permease [Pyrenophora tritici-repentis]KAI0589898.1 High affinity glucose transporter ght1 [Pyrenophora tritici-repentis]KAI0592351.1 High affinity glucose transporter ght1 [Pyrenophora tritici-repentis]
MGLGRVSVRIRGAECGIEAIMLGVITSIGGFLFGYDTGQISGMLIFPDFIRRFGQVQANGEIAFDPTIQSLLVSLMSIGTLIGALAGAYTADFLGRRRNLTAGVFVFVIGNIIQVTAMDSWVHMTMGRIVAGLGVGVLSIGVPMYQSEVCPREIRGAVVASYQLMITVGILVSNIINYGVRDNPGEESDAAWRIVIGLGIAFSIPLGLGVLFTPESPRWLAGKGRWEDARMAMARLRGLAHDPTHVLVNEDFNEMQDAINEQKSAGQGTWLECFTGQPSGIPRLAYRTLMGCAIQFFQQWTGVNYFFYYGATIFRSAGIEDPLQVQLILGAVNVAMTVPGLYLIERVGRRVPLVLGGLWQAAWLLIFAIIGVALPPQDNPTAGVVMIVAACMFIASFAATWGPFVWVIIGESFPIRTRAKQASMATAFNWLGNFLIGFLTPYADDGIGYAFGFVFFACNFAAAGVVYFFVFETKSLSLENVDIMYSDSTLSARTSKKWIPAGYITRNERDDSYWQRRHSAVAADGAIVNEKYDGKDADSSPERGMSMHQERVDEGRRV